MRAFYALVSLLILTALLGAVNYRLLIDLPDISPVFVSSRTGTSADIEPGKLAMDNMLLVQSKTRPLFSPSRRPWAAPVQPQLPAAVDVPIAVIAEPVVPELAPAPAEPPKIRLLGTRITPSGVSALLLRDGASTADWHKSDDVIDAWTIRTIEPDFIELFLKSATVKVELYPVSQPSGSANVQ